MELPYEYYKDKLGIKIKFLISDKHKHFDSLCLISYRAINKRINSKTCPEKELRRASLGNDALISFASLSQDWKDSITIKFGRPNEEIKKNYFSKQYFTDGVAKEFYLAHEYGEDNKKLQLKYVDLYTYNASVLNTVLEVKINRKEYIKSLGVTSIDIWDSLSKDVNAFRDIPHNLPSNKDALRRKVVQYQREGYSAVISGKHAVKNATRIKTKQQLALLEKLLGQHQNLNNEQVADLYNFMAQKIISECWKTIDAATVGNYRKKLGLYVYAGRYGETAFRNDKIMQVTRTAPSVPMVYWTLDGNVTELMYQQKGINKKGHSVTTYHDRLTTVVVLDPFNKYIIGYAIGKEETPQLIKEALRDAVNHTLELFGQRYKPYQLQSDRYQIKNLMPIYEAMSKVFIPTKVKNAKAKVIEPFFDKFNEKHFQAKLALNWSGHNVNAKKKNQPNSDHLNKIRHQFPDVDGCRLQIIKAIEDDRAEKINDYKTNWLQLRENDRLPLSTMDYLRWFGEHTGYTNRLRGEGVTPTILGETRFYDTFDLNFRKYAHLDWLIRYDPQDLTQVLITNAKSKDGRLQEEIGTHQFLLTSKHVQPMSLYDRRVGDSDELHKIFDYNKALTNHVVDHLVESDNRLIELHQKNPQLELLSKLLITDSKGQHKIQKQASQERLVSKKEKMTVSEYADYEIINNPRHNY